MSLWARSRTTLELLKQNGFVVTDAERVPVRGVPPTMRAVVSGHAQSAR